VHVITRIGVHLGLIALFALPAVVLWWHAWDGHLGSTVACACGDSGQQVWFVAWPAYAISHGMNPFLSHAVATPQGANLLASTSSLAVGTALAPVTWMWGPVVATNVALTLAPALSAWGCYVACRRLTTWRPAAVVAALLFGYSPFVIDNAVTGHVQLAVLVVPPLALAAGYELAVTQRGRAWRWGMALGVLVFVQFMISSEILAIMALLAVAAVVLWVALTFRTVRAKLPFLARGSAWAAVTAVLLAAWPAWYSLEGPRQVKGPPWRLTQTASITLSNLWSPGNYSARAIALTRIGGYEGHQGPSAGYLGTLVLLLAAAALVLAYRRRLTWLLALLGIVTLTMALGIFGFTSGSHTLPVAWLPWDTVGRWPIFERVGPQRFVAALDLFVVVLVAVGLDAAWKLWTRSKATTLSPKPAAAGALVVALLGASIGSMVAIARTYEVPLRTEQLSIPAWYTTTATNLTPGSVVLAYPFPMSASGMAQPMVWQAVDGMRFSLAGGYLKLPGPDGQALGVGAPDSAWRTLGALSQKAVGPLPAATASKISALRSALARWDVDDVVVANRGIAPVYAAAYLTAAIGRPPVVSQRAWVWHLGARDAEPSSTAALAAVALHACVPLPAFGIAPAHRPLPQVANDCVADLLAAAAH
jgi:hypothetical protein